VVAVKLREITESKWFQMFIIWTIIVAGVIVGIQTYDKPGSVVHEWADTLDILDQIVLWIFVVEMFMKLGAEGKKPWRYFFDPWNCFDFLIVVVCFLPFNAEYVAVARLLRLLRVIKLVHAVPKLQILVNALLKSIPSMFYVTLLLLLLFYVYGCSAVFMFGDNDPVHFGNLPISMLTLFRVVTGEDWTDVMYIAMMGCENYGYTDMQNLCVDSKAYPVFGALFFVSFMMMGAMIILNLFIGVIMNGMEEAGTELQEVKDELLGGAQKSVEDRLEEISKTLEEIQSRLGSTPQAPD
jgi:voltage-gated sodium channel